MLHEGLPFALAELNFGRMGSGVEVNSAIRLDVQKLKGVGALVREGGASTSTALEGKVKLADVVGEYAAIVSGFYQWFVLRQSELHRRPSRELEALEGKRRDHRQKIRGIEDFLESAERTAIGAREDRERLSKELDEERERREAERARAQELEADLERERNRGFSAGCSAAAEGQRAGCYGLGPIRGGKPLLVRLDQKPVEVPAAYGTSFESSLVVGHRESGAQSPTPQP
jgi:hypothetical protein